MNSLYFPHDHHARHDPKMEKLFFKYGVAGWGVYWALIEMLYEQDGYIDWDNLANHAQTLRINLEMINNIIEDFGLFEFDGNRVWSNSVLARIEKINQKRGKASESAYKRWDANASQTHMPTQCDGNALKVNKIKEKYIGDFEAVWAKYPSKVGKSDALRHFNASIKSEVDFTLINKALQNYLLSKRVKDGFVQNGSTWFNDWRGWLEVKEEPKVHQQKL